MLPAEAELRVATWQTRDFNLIIVVGALAVLLASLLAWPVAAAVRRHYGLPPLQHAGRLWPRRLTLAAAAVDILFIAGWIFGLGIVSSEIYNLNAQLDPWIRGWQLFGLLGVAGAFLSLWNCALAWRDCANPWTRAGCVLVALACLAISWFSFAFNLLTLNLEY